MLAPGIGARAARCSIDGCAAFVFTGKSGLCSAHYSRKRKYGDPLGSRRNPGHPSSPETNAKIRASKLGPAGDYARLPKSAEHRAKIGAASRRNGSDPTFRAAISARRNEHLAICGGECGSTWCGARRYSDTSLERALLGLLVDFPTVETQRRFGRFRVDSYLPEYRLAFEADGTYWHARRSAYDAARDAEILRRFGVTVVRLTEENL